MRDNNGDGTNQDRISIQLLLQSSVETPVGRPEDPRGERRALAMDHSDRSYFSLVPVRIFVEIRYDHEALAAGL